MRHFLWGEPRALNHEKPLHAIDAGAQTGVNVGLANLLAVGDPQQDDINGLSLA
jgi:hypothetical protein